MPVYTVETPAGKQLDIEAPDENTAIKAADQWHAEQTGGKAQGADGTVARSAKALAQGFKDAVQGDVSTAKLLTGNAQPAGDAPRFQAQPIYDKDGLHLGAIPENIAQMSPGLAQDVAAAKVAAKIPVLGKYAAPVAFGGSMLLRNLGRKSAENAAERTGDTSTAPEARDIGRAAATEGLGAAIGTALPGARLLAPSSAAGKVGAEGAIAALKELAGKGVAGGVAGGAQDVVDQVGSSIGTDKGVSYDPTRSANAVLSGALSTTAFGAPRAARDTVDAVKMRDFGGANQEASTQVANHLQQNAKGDLTDPSVGLEALRRTQSDIKGEVGTLANSASKGKQLSTDTQNALNAAKSGRALSEEDISRVHQETGDDTLVNAIRRNNVINMVADTGTVQGDKLTGGASAATGKLWPVANPGKAIAMAMLGHAGNTLVPGLGSLGAGFVGSALAAHGATTALGKFTGSRSPVGRYARKFADGGDVRPTAPAAAGPQLNAYGVPIINPTGVPMKASAALAAALGGQYAALHNAQPAPRINNPVRPTPAAPTAQAAPAAPVAPNPTVAQPAYAPAPLPVHPLMQAAQVMSKLQAQQSYLDKVRKNSPGPLPEAPVAAPAPAVDPIAAAKAIIAQQQYLAKVRKNSPQTEEAPAAPAPVAAPDPIAAARAIIAQRQYVEKVKKNSPGLPEEASAEAPATAAAEAAPAVAPVLAAAKTMRKTRTPVDPAKRLALSELSKAMVDRAVSPAALVPSEPAPAAASQPAPIAPVVAAARAATKVIKKKSGDVKITTAPPQASLPAVAEPTAPAAKVTPATSEMPDIPDFLRRTKAAPALAQAMAEAPVVAEKTEAPQASSFAPKKRGDMEDYGKTASQAAADALQRNKDAGKMMYTDDDRFMEGVLRNRGVIDNAMKPLLESVPPGKARDAVDHLREELHHEGYRARALAATEHYANQLPAALAAKVRETVNGFAKERWKRVNRPGTKGA
jgi:hypothetical protein